MRIICWLFGHKPSQARHPDGSPLFSARYGICTRCHAMPRRAQLPRNPMKYEGRDLTPGQLRSVRAWEDEEDRRRAS